jgi:DnaK suppressor protein
MCAAAAAFDEPSSEIRGATPVLGSGPADDAVIGQTMTNANKSSEPAAETAAPVSIAAEEVSVSPDESEPVQATGTKSAPAKKSAPKRPKDPNTPEFLIEQRALLLEERASYTKQAEELKAEADSLALEHEPGDVQFDEEGGEGGTSNVDRELDLLLSAQARGAVVEIDRALAKIDGGNYGVCEQCAQPIPQARLKALPYASLCVACKSGGLSRR